MGWRLPADTPDLPVLDLYLAQCRAQERRPFLSNRCETSRIERRARRLVAGSLVPITTPAPSLKSDDSNSSVVQEVPG